MSAADTHSIEIEDQRTLIRSAAQRILELHPRGYEILYELCVIEILGIKPSGLEGTYCEWPREAA
jgi:hypothetical protein